MHTSHGRCRTFSTTCMAFTVVDITTAFNQVKVLLHTAPDNGKFAPMKCVNWWSPSSFPSEVNTMRRRIHWDRSRKVHFFGHRETGCSRPNLALLGVDECTSKLPIICGYFVPCHSFFHGSQCVGGDLVAKSTAARVDHDANLPDLQDTECGLSDN